MSPECNLTQCRRVVWNAARFQFPTALYKFHINVIIIMTTQIQLDRRRNMTFKAKTGYNYHNFRCFVSLEIRWNICRLCCKWCQQYGGRRGRKEEVSQWYDFIYCVFGPICCVRGEICHIYIRMWMVVNSFNREMWWLGLSFKLYKNPRSSSSLVSPPLSSSLLGKEE